MNYNDSIRTRIGKTEAEIRELRMMIYDLRHEQKVYMKYGSKFGMDQYMRIEDQICELENTLYDKLEHLDDLRSMCRSAAVVYRPMDDVEVYTIVVSRGSISGRKL